VEISVPVPSRGSSRPIEHTADRLRPWSPPCPSTAHNRSSRKVKELETGGPARSLAAVALGTASPAGRVAGRLEALALVPRWSCPLRCCHQRTQGAHPDDRQTILTPSIPALPASVLPLRSATFRPFAPEPVRVSFAVAPPGTETVKQASRRLKRWRNRPRGDRLARRDSTVGRPPRGRPLARSWRSALTLQKWRFRSQRAGGSNTRRRRASLPASGFALRAQPILRPFTPSAERYPSTLLTVSAYASQDLP